MGSTACCHWGTGAIVTLQDTVLLAANRGLELLQGTDWLLPWGEGMERLQQGAVLPAAARWDSGSRGRRHRAENARSSQPQRAVCTCCLLPPLLLALTTGGHQPKDREIIFPLCVSLLSCGMDTHQHTGHCGHYVRILLHHRAVSSGWGGLCHPQLALAAACGVFALFHLFHLLLVG